MKNEAKELKTSDEVSGRVDPLVRFLFRPHREMLADAMKEMREFSSRQELVDFLQADLDKYGAGNYDCSDVTIEKYGDGIDERIGWDTHIVHLAGWGVLGFTNAQPET